MDALELLTKDHEVVRRLFSEFKTAKESEDTSRLASLKEQIFNELEVHTGIEEEVFYPAAKEVGGEAEELISEGVEEHHVVEVLMGEIAQLEPGDDTWTAKMTVLIENVEHHAGEEEDELFPEIRSKTTAEDRDTLGQQLDTRKGELGAPMLDATKDLTLAQLHELATAQSIPGRSTMGHDELAATVSP